MNSYSLDYIDDLYVQYIQDPASVSEGWRKYFEEFSLASQTLLEPSGNGNLHLRTGPDGAVAPLDESNEQTRQMRDEALWLQLSENGLTNVTRHFSFESARAAVRRLLDSE